MKTQTNILPYFGYYSSHTYLLLAILFLSNGCSPEEKNDADKFESPPSPSITIVKTDLVRYTNFNYVIQGSGEIKAQHEQKILSKKTGKIDLCHAKNNIIVRYGDILVRFDVRAIQIEINKAKEALFNSKLNYNSDLLSQESLLRNKSKGIRDTVYRKLRSSSGLTGAEQELTALNLEMSEARIDAPFHGKLANVKCQQGMYVRSGDELFTIYSHNQMFVETNILESDIASVKIGQKAEVDVLANSLRYDAVVSEVNPIIDVNGTISVRLRFLDIKDLLPGMHATVNILAPKERTLVVPKTAIVIRNNKTVVFTLENGRAKWNYVQIGRDNGREVEIRQGLKGNQKIIITNNLQLSNDTSVKEQGE